MHIIFNVSNQYFVFLLNNHTFGMDKKISNATQEDWNTIIKKVVEIKQKKFPFSSEEKELINNDDFFVEVYRVLLKMLKENFPDNDNNSVIQEIEFLVANMRINGIKRQYFKNVEGNRAQKVIAKVLLKQLKKQNELREKAKKKSLLKKIGLGLLGAGAVTAAGFAGHKIYEGLDPPNFVVPEIPEGYVEPWHYRGVHYPEKAGPNIQKASTALVSPDAPSFLLKTLAKQGALDMETLAKQRALDAAEAARNLRTERKQERDIKRAQTSAVEKGRTERRAQLQRVQGVADEHRLFPETEDDVHIRGESVTEEKAEEEMAPIRAAELAAFQTVLNDDFISPTFSTAFLNLSTLRKARIIVDFVKGPMTNLATSYKYVPLSEIEQLHLTGDKAVQTPDNYEEWKASLHINDASLPTKAIETDDKEKIHTNYAKAINYFLELLPVDPLAGENNTRIITAIRTNLIALRDAPWLYGTEYPVFNTIKRNDIFSKLDFALRSITLGGTKQKASSRRSRSRRNGKSSRRSRSRSGRRKSSRRSRRYYAYM